MFSHHIRTFRILCIHCYGLLKLAWCGHHKTFFSLQRTTPTKIKRATFLILAKYNHNCNKKKVNNIIFVLQTIFYGISNHHYFETYLLKMKKENSKLGLNYYRHLCQPLFFPIFRRSSQKTPMLKNFPTKGNFPYMYALHKHSLHIH